VEQAISSLLTSDAYLAGTVIESDKAINSFEIDIDNSTFNFLAMATGGLMPDRLRRIVSIQKINPILERIGDHAANIADAAIALANGPVKQDLYAINEMADKCRTILHDAITGFMTGNADLAKEVLERDDDIDNRYRSIIETIKSLVLAGSSELSFDNGLSLIRICKDLERVADLSMNIAEEAIYAIEGHVVKHPLIAKTGD
jgi:phosphate transport system protein